MSRSSTRTQARLQRVEECRLGGRCRVLNAIFQRVAPLRQRGHYIARQRPRMTLPDDVVPLETDWRASRPTCSRARWRRKTIQIRFSRALWLTGALENRRLAPVDCSQREEGGGLAHRRRKDMQDIGEMCTRGNLMMRGPRQNSLTSVRALPTRRQLGRQSSRFIDQISQHTSSTVLRDQKRKGRVSQPEGRQ